MVRHRPVRAATRWERQAPLSQNGEGAPSARRGAGPSKYALMMQMRPEACACAKETDVDRQQPNSRQGGLADGDAPPKEPWWSLPAGPMTEKSIQAVDRTV